MSWNWGEFSVILFFIAITYGAGWMAGFEAGRKNTGGSK